MKKLSKVAVLGSTLIMSSSAFALDMPDMGGYYYNVQYAMLDLDVSNDNGSGTASLPGLALEIGTNVYKHDLADINLEAVVVIGLDEEAAFGSSGSQYMAELDSGVGVQLEANRRFTSDIAGFVNLGIMNISTTVTNEGRGGVALSARDSATDTGTTFAFGAEYQLNSSAAVTLSYNSLSSGADVDVTSLNIGYKANF